MTWGDLWKAIQSFRRDRRVRKLGWDVVLIAATVGIGYGAWELVATYGGSWGIFLALMSVAFGVVAFDMLYPLWFRDNGRNGNNGRG